MSQLAVMCTNRGSHPPGLGSDKIVNTLIIWDLQLVVNNALNKPLSGSYWPSTEVHLGKKYLKHHV